MDVAKRYQDDLPRLKKCVKNFSVYFEPNYKRFNEFRKFVFDTSLNDSDKMVLEALKKPQIEFNIGEAYISRLRGEFSKQQPSVSVSSEEGLQPDPELQETVKGHLKHIIADANKDGCEYNVYTDILSGGFSAIKIWTEYAKPFSFNQVVKFGRVYDPTLVGFDPLARQSHKGDGRYCFELFPKSREEFEEEYPHIDLKGVDFTRKIEGFNWAYSNNQEDILLLCDFYEKKKKKVRIVKLVNGYVMEYDDYKLFVEKWNESGLIEQAPAIVGKPRWTEVEKIVRYRFIENKVIEYVETDFTILPIVFIDGNSIILRQGTQQGAFVQMTRPYIYHLKGLQQLKNFAGQTLANELENMVQHKFKVAKESLPDEQSYLDAYTNIQLANTLVYKAFKDNDPKQPVPAPQEIQRVPPPGEVINTFTLVDQMSQSILGSYDASLGINDNQLSGTAIVEGATQSNSAAMPYIVSYMQGLSHVLQGICDVLPKYYITKRTIPIIDEDGKRDYKTINDQNGISFNYDENALNVKVEAGINFAIQKARSQQQIVALSQAMPIFGQFMNAKGLKVLVGNLEIEDQDQLKVLADEFMIEMKQQQEQQMKAQEEAVKNNPAMLKAQNDRMKIQMDAQKSQSEMKIKAADMAVSKQQADTDFLRVLAEMHNAKAEMQAQVEKAQAEETRAAVDLAIKHADMRHSHVMDHKSHELNISELEHKKSESKKNESMSKRKKNSS